LEERPRTQPAHGTGLRRCVMSCECPRIRIEWRPLLRRRGLIARGQSRTYSDRASEISEGLNPYSVPCCRITVVVARVCPVVDFFIPEPLDGIKTITFYLSCPICPAQIKYTTVVVRSILLHIPLHYSQDS
jgi:hypothetical protein